MPPSESFIQLQLLHDDAVPPRRATAGAAGYDLCAHLRGRTVRCSDGTREWEVAADRQEEGGVTIPPGVMALVPLGFRARLPDGYEAQIRPRSGTSFRRALQIPNAPGTVDADFPDEWMVIVRNGAAAPLRIAHGERIAQAVLARFEVLEWRGGAVERSTDRRGGFGSTGY